MLLLAVLLVATPCAPAAARGPDEGSVAELVAELDSLRDNAPPELVRRLANAGTPEAARGLVDVYEQLLTPYMRRAVLQGLANFDGVEGAEQAALDKLRDVATGSTRADLREAALDSLARCERLGRAYLATIVESEARADVRIEAMDLHVQRARPRDARWYRAIFELGLGDPARLPPERLAELGLPEGYRPLPELRRAAFAGLVGELASEALVAATGDFQASVRRRALEELFARGDPAALEIAWRTWRETRDAPANRLAAARVILAAEGDEEALGMCREASRVGTPRVVLQGVADLVREREDPRLEKELLKLLRKRDRLPVLFALRALEGASTPGLDDQLVKLLRSRDLDVAREALAALARRGDRAFAAELRDVLDDPRREALAGDALAALGTLLDAEPEWREDLVALCRHELPVVRCGALEQLGELAAGGADVPREVFLAALSHADWRTRLFALRALELQRAAWTVEPLIARMELEDGRLQHELAEALWRLTAQHFGLRTEAWRQWWEDRGDAFEVVSLEELERAERLDEVRRLQQSTSIPFFGLRIRSDRVVFLIDVSGSMQEPTRAHYEHEEGEPRIDVAKRELLKALDALDGTSLVNVVAFSDNGRPWLDAIGEFDLDRLDKARAWVRRLRADGGTNLWEALELAFEDPDLDTIVILSDGEPSVGDRVDPDEIGAEVARWNARRGVEIHTIAIGGALDLLERLAADSGGDHLSIP